MRNFILRTTLLSLILGLSNYAIASRMWGEHGTFAGSDFRAVRPSLCPLGELEMAAAFPSIDENGVYRAAIQGVDRDGVLYFEDEPLFLSSPDKWMFESNIIAEPDGEGGVFVIWQARTDSFRLYDVYAQHLDQDLNLLWDEGGVLLYTTNKELTNTRSNFYGVLVSDEGGLIIVDRVWIGERERFYENDFFVRKFDSDGSLTEDWPEEGEQLFENPTNIQFYQDPGRGLWCFGRNGSRHATLQINLIQPDGMKRYEETILPELPENTAADDFTPDRTGGFYLMLYEYGEDDLCRGGIQRYNSDGRPVWGGGNIWFTNVNLAHISQVPIASENGSRVFCFSYDGHGGDSPVSTRLNWIEPQENRPRLLLEDPIFLRNSQVEPFFYMDEGELLINVTHYNWRNNINEWIDDEAEANIISPGGRLSWEEGTAPIEPRGIAVLRDWESFYVTTEIGTPDFDSDLRIDFLNLFAEREWEEPAQVYLMPQFGEMIAEQILPNLQVRLIGRKMMNPGPHETSYNFQLVNPDGSLQFPIEGQRFIDLIEWSELATSDGSLIMVRYEGNRPYTFTDVSVLDDQNIVHPEEPLPLRDLHRDGEFREVFGDSAGGAFLLFRTGDEDNWQFDVVRVDQNCEWDNEVLRPFERTSGRDLQICADGDGGAWVLGTSVEGGLLLQRISAENSLVWDEQQELEWDAMGAYSPSLLAAGDGSLWMLARVQTENQDSINVMMMSYDQDGEPRWEEPVAAFEPNAGLERPNLDFKAISNSDGEVWLVVKQIAAGQIPFHVVRLQKMSPDGERLFGERGLNIPRMIKSHRPELLDDEDGGVWMFMEVYDIEPPYLRAFHFDRDGDLIDEYDEPDPNGTAVITHLADGGSREKFFPPWRYEDGSVGIAFRYDDTMRAQRLNDELNEAPLIKKTPPDQFEITSVYPSPSNDRVTVVYRLDRTGRIDLTLADFTGRQVGWFYAGVQTVGEHQVSLSTGELASGAYVIQLRALGMTTQKVFVELK